MGNKVIIGENDLLTFCKNNGLNYILEEWNYELNNYSKPTDYTAKSNKKVWWKCKKGHEWDAAISPRTTKKAGCPFCSGLKPTKDNNLFVRYPEIASQWNFDKNKTLPQDFTPKSSRKVWWKCEKGHEWEAVISSRTRLNAGCPYCSGRKILSGFNDLATLFPELLSEWNYEKNKNKPTEIGVGYPVWWKCKKGHEWKTSASARGQGTGCPYCKGRLAIEGENDLLTVNPQLASEWNYKKNGDRTPNNVKANSHYKVWWKCERGHEWQAVISDRNNGNGCPMCSGVSTSLAEQGIAFYLSKIYEIEQRVKINGFEVDIFLPQYNIGIEYDGVYYHNSKASKAREQKKNKALLDEGITLYRVKETNKEDKIEDNTIYYTIDTHLGDNYSKAIETLIGLLSKATGIKTVIKVDAKADSLKIREICKTNKRKNSFASNYPELSLEWDYEKNGTLTPEVFSSHSPQKVWWICKEGHSYKSSLDDRAKGRGCPYCSNQKLLKGFNDLETWCKNNHLNNLIDEWDYSKNRKLPSEFPPKSHAKVWWVCNKRHSYQAVISNRVGVKSNCPICNNTKLLQGFNDLQTRFPELLSEWDYEKNEIKPNEVLSGTHRKVWWRCNKGHEWNMEIAKRTSKSRKGCPICGKSMIGKSLSKPVINLDTGEIFESVTDAKRKTGIDNISNCCLGKYKSAGGYHWAFYNI